MGITEEPTAASVDQAEQSVHDVILDMLEQDLVLDAAVKDAVLDALAEVVGQAQDNRETPTAPTFLTSISVAGFRGIGRQARLDLYPAPSLMVVSGRTGPENPASPKRWNLPSPAPATAGTRRRRSGRNHGRTCTIRTRVPSESASRRRAPVRSRSARTGRRGPRSPSGRLGRRLAQRSGATVPTTSAGRVHWNCGVRSCPTTNWVGSSTAGRRLSMTRWPSCSASKC